MERKSGILMHISSLPNPYGLGSLGKEAYRFIDFLKAGGQTYWQVLPITPTNYGDSPYQSSSVYAYNPYFIDFDMLNKMGVLYKKDYKKEYYGDNPLDADYANLFYVKNKVLKKAKDYRNRYQKQFAKFKEENASWLDGFALYEAIKESFGYTAWNTWPDEYRLRDEKTIAKFAKKNHEQIEQKKFIQFLFAYQWKRLKKYANKNGVKIIGDMPIYVAYDSADVWANPGMFWLDENLNPVKVAGCPPDAFSPDGQLWGNPIYRYDLMKQDGYTWWVKRIKKSFEMFDVVRIDHFRGFAGYFTIPFGDETARNGNWVEGPGYELFKAVNKAIPNAQIIAENLGFLDESVHKLLDDCGYPGMYITQFDFGNGYDYHPMQDGLISNNVIYTGTHDNQTIQSWYNELDDHLRYAVNEYFHIPADGKDANLKIIEGTMATNVDTCIIPLQDYIGLVDKDGRMNIPSTLGCNWRYRALATDYNDKLAEYIYSITKKTNRL